MALVTARLAVRVYTRPLDVSGRWQVPRVIELVKERDAVAYPAHVVFATVLDAAGAAPTAVGLQWVKAAAHAHNQVQMQRVPLGSRRRSGGRRPRRILGDAVPIYPSERASLGICGGPSSRVALLRQWALVASCR